MVINIYAEQSWVLDVYALYHYSCRNWKLVYTKEFLGAACYFAGFSSIFFRRYIRVLLRDLSKMPNYSCSEYQLQLFHNINQGYIKFILLTSYFFLTGTLILLYLP